MTAFNGLRCDPCWRNQKHRAAVGRIDATEGFNWRLCEEHFISAAGCGFYPVKYGDTTAMTPMQAAAIAKQRRTESVTE